MEIIIDNVLCFINSALSDYSQEKLVDIIHSFYSHEEIKNAKEKIFNILGKDMVTRRDPDKKGKDLNDLLQGYLDCKEKFKRHKYVADNYKKIPPVGMEFIAPLLINLSCEITKINDLLPKILDIKTTVSNTADAVRDIKIDINHLKQSTKQLDLNNCESKQKNETMIKSFRQKDVSNIPASTKTVNSSATSESNTCGSNASPSKSKTAHTSLKDNVSVPIQTSQMIPADDQDRQQPSSDVTSAVSSQTYSSKTSYHDISSLQSKTTSAQYNDDIQNERKENDHRGWITIDRKKKSKNQNRFQSRSLVTGAKSSDGKFKAADKTCDLFIGKVAKSVEVISIKDYIESNFNVKVLNIAIMEIKTAYFNAFKVTLSNFDREKLFQPDKWPEGVVIDKFYNRNQKGKSI